MALSYRQLSPLLKQQIIAAFQEGMECREIPQYLHVSDRSVRRVLLEAGVNTKRRNRYQLDETYFDIIDSQVKAYLLGLMAADGCVTTKNYVAYESIEISLVSLLKNNFCKQCIFHCLSNSNFYLLYHSQHKSLPFFSQAALISLNPIFWKA